MNFYEDGGLETFTNGDGCVQLEIYVHKDFTSRLCGGRDLQHCVRGPMGEVCCSVAITALLVHRSNVPVALELW